jgi:hypothetical protein
MAKRKKPDPEQRVRLTDFPMAMAAAKEYMQALEAAYVPFSIGLEHDELTDLACGFNVAVDAIGNDGFAHWVVLPFHENGFHPDGFTTRHGAVTFFERASLASAPLAAGLARCRSANARPVVVTKEKSDSYYGTRPIQILEFHNA